MPESQQLFFGLQLVSRIFEEFQHPTIQTNGFSQQIKERQPIGSRKKGFCTNRDPNKQEVGFFLYEAAQNFEVFSSIQN
jgi:hypothetical protein